MTRACPRPDDSSAPEIEVTGIEDIEPDSEPPTRPVFVDVHERETLPAMPEDGEEET